MKLRIIVVIAVVLLAVNLSRGAAVRSEVFAEQLRRIFHDTYPDISRAQRATESGNENGERRNCNNIPCGWNNYNVLTRRSTLFIKNTCECPDETYKCVHTGESVSMRAYVYHCRQNATEDDIDSSD